MKNVKIALSAVFISFLLSQAFADDIYGPYPVTLKVYEGEKTNSVSYSGQVGRQLLHNSLKKAISNGASLEELNSYFNGSDNMLKLLDPKSSDSFKVDVTNINDVSKTNLSGKAFKGDIAGWPGNMSGKAVLENMIVKASQAEKGYDAAHGYDYAQLVSKFTMGAVFYHQACDNYLDEKLSIKISRIISLIKMALITLGKNILGMKVSVIGVQQHMVQHYRLVRIMMSPKERHDGSRCG